MSSPESDAGLGPLAASARDLAARHAVSHRSPIGVPVWRRIVSMPGWLERAQAACVECDPEANNAAEWLLDNDYHVERAVRQIRRDMPQRYYHRLPALANPGEEGLPRVFALAHGFLRASRLQLSLNASVQFIRAYQTTAPLTIAELWAFPTMLRLACLEVLVFALGRLIPDLDRPFDPTPPAAEAGAFEDTECVARALANLAVIATIPWKDFFERTSCVEEVLAGDPAGVYPRMDFDTRDRYRKAIEDLADEAGRSEPDIAGEVLATASRTCDGGSDGHVGHWLIGDGRGEMERSLGCRPRWRVRLGRWLLRNADLIYAAALVVAGLGALILPALYLWLAGAGPLQWVAGIAVVLIPATLIGVTVVQWTVTQLVPPRVLPKLDFAKAIPADCPTAVVVPALVTSAGEVVALIERLEGHQLANPDPSLRFVLLSDLADAPQERTPDDDEVEKALTEGIRRLNGGHGDGGDGPFHLLHRFRRHNYSEGCWMGWERKRGKLEQFNRLVLGEEVSDFRIREGDSAALRGIRFVVTVDVDTILPPGTVARLVGTLAHPLNAARFDEETGRVHAGYTIVQPRVEISPESSGSSLFTRLYAGDVAIDIYSRAVSDVYQDLFGSGIFVGKGIYEVASFQRSLDARVPENAVVSHDLFEGVHGRAALATDIVLYETFPGGYLEHTRRLHRWVRGDWQLLPWLARYVPAVGGSHVANRLSGLDRWKLFDNLRRSLVSPALVLLLAAGWLFLPGSPWVWTALAVAAPGAHLFTDLVTGLARGRRRGAARAMFNRLASHSGRWLLALVFLVQDAAVALDAVLRALWRLFVSRRGLLEWVSAAQMAARLAGGGRAEIWRRMWLSPAVAVALAVAAAWVNPMALLPAAPLLLLWLASPEVAAWTGRSRRPRMEQLTAEQRLFLRRIARRTWFYYERFVGPEDHWLPPDNYQEEPHAEIAHRTSPTNIGMMFVASLTAWDLGYVGPSDLVARIREGLDSLDRLERHRGHFLNWYDTRSLKPLEPRYVSTVDSGNLAVSLLALKEGCREVARGPALRPRLFDGLADLLALLQQALDGIESNDQVALRERLEALARRISDTRENPGRWRTYLADLCDRDWPETEAAIGVAMASARVPGTGSLREVRVWLERVRHHVARMSRDFETLLPWLALTEAPAAGCEDVARGIWRVVAPSAPLADAEERSAEAREMLAQFGTGMDTDASARWVAELDAALVRGARHQGELRDGLLEAASRLDALAFAMDFRPLYDEDLRLFHIGYNVSSDRIDPHHYDLLATEARLASFFAIAKRDVPPEHWFHLGRPVTRVAGGLTLVSWNGSMFEYLMPTLFLRGGPDTLLGQSELTAVDIQRRHAERLGTPWGTSESAFAARDPEHRYRYRAFGVPGLGLKRGLSRDHVIAPYASALALPVRTAAAIENLAEMDRLGLIGLYGPFEAADFTPDRVPAGHQFVAVRAYMAHHQGMILTALANALSGDVFVRRVAADRRMRTMALLLHERVPWESPPGLDPERERAGRLARAPAGPALRAWQSPVGAAFPQVHTLGNGRLATWISDAGAGGQSWHGHALTRWLPDPTCDDRGLWVYVRDEEDGAVWSAGRQPTGAIADEANVVFHPHLAEFHRRDRGIALRMEVGIAPGDDVEIRRVTVVNDSGRRRALALTSCGEVVLAPPLDDERHPAFSKLFVGAEFLPGWDGLLFTRRPRHRGDAPPVLLHRMIADERGLELAGFEADRRSFLGRGGDYRRPRGVVTGLSGTTGWTLDPVMALQTRVTLDPHESRQFAFLTLAAGSRESVLELAERYASLSALDWTFGDAATHARREAYQLGLESDRLPELQTLASLLLHPHPALRVDSATIAANRLGQTRLWAFGLSGDWPILLVRASDPRETALLNLLVRAHALWRRRGIHIDLVVLRIGTAGYAEPLRERVSALLQEAGVQEMLGRRAGIHFLPADQMSEDERRLLETAARVVLDEAAGSLARQIEGIAARRPELPRFESSGLATEEDDLPPLARPEDLLFDNGYGGFSSDGREYVIHLEPGASTPAPWCNVIANDVFGCIVTEVGGGFTWSVNSGENRLTPWTNDPVADLSGEALYLRDEETAEVWTPTPRPAGAGVCQVRHGAGYTCWRQRSHGIEQELVVFVPCDEPVKIVRLRLANLRSRPRRVTATYYAEWLLGALGSLSRPFIVCEYEPACHALMARNPWSADFGKRVAFLTSSLPPHGVAADRREFLGREGSVRRPAALLRWGLSGRVEAGDDPCAAFQVHLDIDAGETKEVVFILGQGRDRAEAEMLARRWQNPLQIERALDELGRYWDRQLGSVRVRTPDPAFDLMVNRWLLYQTMASRVMARAGFYQAGGAFGFRDQLQDMLALLHTDPNRTRAHIVAAAARQFEEGDVLHWWHPPADRGVRTRCSDDLLWLPYVVGRYVAATGDLSILDVKAPYLHADPLLPDEDDRYDHFETAAEPGSLFEHCERALQRGVTHGPHGLPLIGTGDWNDGMDRVGRAGRGESVWLAWFAIATMSDFAAMSSRIGREDVAERWTAESEKVRGAVEATGWDGAWYMRAFDDDGRPWGSAASEECRIDSIAQSWSVLSGAGSRQRARTALDSAERELVRESDGLVRLLWPPFDATPRDPGYIKAYPPGIRENGGQYTHAAAWLGLAFAGVSDGERASRVFDLINPIHHATNRAEAERYRVEPYVLAADIAGVDPHVGRGGWTWYTGSSAWAWRLAVEGILGLTRVDGGVLLEPCLPPRWSSVEIEVNGPRGTLAFRIDNPDHVSSRDVELTVDGLPSRGTVVAFPTDGSVRRVGVRAFLRKVETAVT